MTIEIAGDERLLLAAVRRRVADKGESYRRYNFSEVENAALRAFFDLAQEYDDTDDFFRVCVTVPLVFLKLPIRLYLLDEHRETLSLICDSEHGLVTDPIPARPAIRLTCHTYQADDSVLVPIQRKPSLHESRETRSVHDLVMGVLEVPDGAALGKEHRLFLRKYANRIGYNLHNRLIAQQNIRHLKFINNLVADIEHNVITPNMYFRHLFNQIKKRLGELERISNEFAAVRQNGVCEPALCADLESRLEVLYDDLASNHREMLEHYNNYSLFLESLFRRDHFRKGHLVLNPKKCSVEKEVIAPQLDHYGNRLVKQGIMVAQPTDMKDEEVPLRVDVGLLSQVYANLFSNAVKYTAAAPGPDGEGKKVMAYGREYLPDYFGPGRAGVKFNVFTTGPHLPPDEVNKLYADGFRGEASKGKPGTGHGLAFVKQVVEIHGGVSGYEPTAEGNNFYFILPLSAEDEIPA